MIDPRTYQAIVIAKALELYANTGIKVNTAYTPSNMMAAASRLTGKTFRPRDYREAAKSLMELVK